MARAPDSADQIETPGCASQHNPARDVLTQNAAGPALPGRRHHPLMGGATTRCVVAMGVVLLLRPASIAPWE